MGAAKSRGVAFWNDPEDPRHGTTNGYGNLECRCEPCTAANTAFHRKYMHDNREQRIVAAARNRHPDRPISEDHPYQERRAKWKEDT